MTQGLLCRSRVMLVQRKIQPSGRDRRGRVWVSIENGLYRLMQRSGIAVPLEINVSASDLRVRIIGRNHKDPIYDFLSSFEIPDRSIVETKLLENRCVARIEVGSTLHFINCLIPMPLAALDIARQSEEQRIIW